MGGSYPGGGGLISPIKVLFRNEQIRNKLILIYSAIQINTFSIYLRLKALKSHNKSGISFNIIIWNKFSSVLLGTKTTVKTLTVPMQLEDNKTEDNLKLSSVL